MRVICIGLMLLAMSAHADCVIVLHGLARTEASMAPVATALKADGFDVVNVGYPSREKPIDELAVQAIRPALQQCPPAAKVHFVTHSLGGILVRQYLSEHAIPQLHRVVMLGPPNQGSEVVDKLADVPGFQLLNGPAGLQLGTGRSSVPNQLGDANFDVGIIAGNRSINLILSTLIPGNDDGKVAIERTKLPGMRDHLVLPVTHTFMMRDDAVIQQIKHFLKHGQFGPDAIQP